MNRIQRCLAALARRARALLVLAAAGPAALITFPPPEPTAPPVPANAHSVVVGGMPGWQITLIAAGPRWLPPSWRCASTGPARPGAE